MNAARQQLVNDHLHLPAVIATACRAELDLSGVVSLDDMVAYGHQGLLEAAERYSPDVGTKFITYSWHRIRGAVIDGVRESGPYGRAQMSARRALDAATDSGASLGERSPANDNGFIAALLVQSDVPVDEIAAAEDSNLEAAVDNGRLRAAVVRAVAGLPGRQRPVIEMHYFQGYPFTEVSRRLGITREYVARLHTRALRHLEGALAETVRAHEGEEISR